MPKQRLSERAIRTLTSNLKSKGVQAREAADPARALVALEALLATVEDLTEQSTKLLREVSQAMSWPEDWSPARIREALAIRIEDQKLALEPAPADPEHPWDRAASVTLTRHNAASSIYSGVPIDRGVNYFLLQIERLGGSTTFSCEGHPAGFYLIFSCNAALAEMIAGLGFMSVQIAGQGQYRLEISTVRTEGDRVRVLRWAAQAWEKAFGPLDFDLISKTALTEPLMPIYSES